MLLTIERHETVRRFTGIDLRVLIGGADVTDRCASADDEQGWALVYQIDERGRKYLKYHERHRVHAMAVEILMGRVLFSPRR